MRGSSACARSATICWSGYVPPATSTTSPGRAAWYARLSEAQAVARLRQEASSEPPGATKTDALRAFFGRSPRPPRRPPRRTRRRRRRAAPTSRRVMEAEGSNPRGRARVATLDNWSEVEVPPWLSVHWPPGRPDVSSRAMDAAAHRPRVSVITPVRNGAARHRRAARLPRAPDASRARTSRSSSATTARPTAARPASRPRTATCASPSARRATPTRRATWPSSASRGEVLAFCDADCRPEPDWLERGARRRSRRPTSSPAASASTCPSRAPPGR